MTNFESYLKDITNRTIKESTIRDAMLYSLEGGKRIRPRIIFAILNGFNISEDKGYAAASALEYIQTYSLIHDDLPAMDNDDYRRGKLTSHKKFGEGIAILTGDALLTHSFGLIADSDYKDSVKTNLVSTLASYSGMNGMIYGQLLDITTNSKELTDEKLFEIDDNKTGGLFKCACLFAMYIAECNKPCYFINLGSKIGVIFQLQDDLFDIIRSEKEMGKSLSDKENDKGSATVLYSVDELKNIIDNKFKELDDYLKDAPFNPSALSNLLKGMASR